ncbi:phage tail tube protein [Aliidiomarina sp. Khilg15.8]
MSNGMRVVLGAGTKFKFKTDGTTPEFALIPEVRTIGDTGSESPLVETTPIDKTAKEYIAGISDGDEKDIAFNILRDDAVQKEFREAARARENREFQVEFPNGVTATFTMTLLSYRINNPEAEQSLQATVKAKVSGAVVWDEAGSGSTT